jgi:hypothetical protein
MTSDTSPRVKRAAAIAAFTVALLSFMTLNANSINIIRDTPDTGIALEVMAHEWSVTQPIGFSPGHAFMCISIRLQSGVKEDCYGFFKVTGEGGLISGPGVKLDQMNDPAAIPARFSRVSVSIKKDITDSQRRAIIKAAEDWNAHHYNLTKENCIDFVAQAARIAQWAVPPRNASDTPDSWVRRLKDAEDLEGVWTGTSTSNGRTLPMSILVTLTNGQWGGQINLNDQGDTFRDVSVQGRSISFVVGQPNTPFKFSGTVSSDERTLSGTFTSTVASGSFTLSRQPD